MPSVGTCSVSVHDSSSWGHGVTDAFLESFYEAIALVRPSHLYTVIQRLSSQIQVFGDTIGVCGSASCLLNGLEGVVQQLSERRVGVLEGIGRRVKLDIINSGAVTDAVQFLGCLNGGKFSGVGCHL